MGYAPSPARKHIGKTRLARRHIVFFGNCQAGEVARLCRRFLAPRSGDIVDVIDVPLHDARSARQLLARADVIVEQVFDNRQEIWLRLLERDHVDIRAEYHDRKIIRFPTVTGIFYWPYANQPHPRNAEIEKGYDAGPYPDEMGDSFLNRRIAAGVSPDEALEQYLAED
ncbi:MAG TPA: hypothetical protein VMB26_04365, partial [Candidatus Binataceae bacterium]|nr:hypothetical protein [Candidatus Binataceae bacterium]